jgi:hypothetical protein
MSKKTVFVCHELGIGHDKGEDGEPRLGLMMFNSSLPYPVVATFDTMAEVQVLVTNLIKEAENLWPYGDLEHSNKGVSA